ncbi:hypothetical protein SJAV_26250 [Sulfurisphaera javensis]|uniref:Uncharacterized protein n=1 Tax=Sulfurisphaera javensis TaxID=2049879 RepID=A0AAT9GVI4_9CREN
MAENNPQNTHIFIPIANFNYTFNATTLELKIEDNNYKLEIKLENENENEKLSDKAITKIYSDNEGGRKKVVIKNILVLVGYAINDNTLVFTADPCDFVKGIIIYAKPTTYHNSLTRVTLNLNNVDTIKKKLYLLNLDLHNININDNNLNIFARFNTKLKPYSKVEKANINRDNALVNFIKNYYGITNDVSNDVIAEAIKDNFKYTVLQDQQT